MNKSGILNITRYFSSNENTYFTIRIQLKYEIEIEIETEFRMNKMIEDRLALDMEDMTNKLIEKLYEPEKIKSNKRFIKELSQEFLNFLNTLNWIELCQVHKDAADCDDELTRVAAMNILVEKLGEK